LLQNTGSADLLPETKKPGTAAPGLNQAPFQVPDF
jgi:hypothetical protein